MLIIPTYNEHDNIAVLVGRIRKAAGNEPILFVDDNSPDRTADEIRRIQAADPDVHLLARPVKADTAPPAATASRKFCTKISRVM